VSSVFEEVALMGQIRNLNHRSVDILDFKYGGLREGHARKQQEERRFHIVE
jgi:hypothetical protein